MKKFHSKGFTLIELLIVVAIIAILAAIAVPNFLEAQTRSKVSRAKSDIRSLATAIESYAVDANNRYPFDLTRADGITPGTGYYWYMSNVITTPIAYISNNSLKDPFRDRTTTLPDAYARYRFVNYTLADFNLERGFINAAFHDSYMTGRDNYGFWRLSSSGPDHVAGPYPPPIASGLYFPAAILVYDPTNGTTSRGDIVRSHKNSDSSYVHRDDYP